MPPGTDLWLATVHETVYGSSGWAFARRVDGMVTGAAGGERRSTPRRMFLTALVEGLKDLRGPPLGAAPGHVTLHAALPEAAEILAILDGKAAAPEEDLDLWAPVLTAKGPRGLVLKAAPMGPDTPLAFLTAWADLTREKARARGQFRAVLPKPNLAGVNWA